MSKLIVSTVCAALIGGLALSAPASAAPAGPSAITSPSSGVIEQAKMSKKKKMMMMKKKKMMMNKSM